MGSREVYKVHITAVTLQHKGYRELVTSIGSGQLCVTHLQ